MMDGFVIYFLIAVAVIAAMLFIVIALTRRGGSTLDKRTYQSAWLAIELSLKKDDISSYHLAVLNADKLLDQALRERGTPGQTMGERLRATKSIWSNRNTLWTAHKLRNTIAHETNAKVTYAATVKALVAFKRALKDIGAI